MISREIRLKERPVGIPTNENFELAQVDIPEPRDGEFIVRNIWMSVDPYMRGRMTERKSYVPPFELGKALEGGCVGKVVESKNDQFAVGDYVLGMNGWREYWISDGSPSSSVSKIDPSMGPIQFLLGIFGMTGLTAYVGLVRIGQLKEGETVFVSADHYNMINDFHSDMAKWVKEGKIKWRETVFEGLENAPKAFIALFNGENFGKTLVKIGPG